MKNIKLHDLAKETSRAMQFFGYKIDVETFPRGYITTIICVPIRCTMTETEHVPSDPNEIEFIKRMKEKAIFKDADTPYETKTVDIRGKFLALSKKGDFLEIDVVGQRDTPTCFLEDIYIGFKNPVERDISHVLENYKDAYEALLRNVKYLIQVAIILTPKKENNLARIIEYIKNLENLPVERNEVQ